MKKKINSYFKNSNYKLITAYSNDICVLMYIYDDDDLSALSPHQLWYYWSVQAAVSKICVFPLVW